METNGKSLINRKKPGSNNQNYWANELCSKEVKSDFYGSWNAYHIRKSWKKDIVWPDKDCGM